MKMSNLSVLFDLRASYSKQYWGADDEETKMNHGNTLYFASLPISRYRPRQGDGKGEELLIETGE